jgi:hypothetical protein
MPRAAYDPELRKSEHGARLYEYWRRIRRPGPIDPAFAQYIDFYNWAMDAGYELGSWLRRYDDQLPYGPDNCYWEPRDGEPLWAEEWRKKWDDTVNKLRGQFGLPPLKGGES